MPLLVAPLQLAPTDRSFWPRRPLEYPQVDPAQKFLSRLMLRCWKTARLTRAQQVSVYAILKHSSPRPSVTRSFEDRSAASPPSPERKDRANRRKQRTIFFGHALRAVLPRVPTYVRLHVCVCVFEMVLLKIGPITIITRKITKETLKIFFFGTVTGYQSPNNSRRPFFRYR